MKNYYTCQNKKLVRRKTYSFYLSKSLWCLGRFKSAQFLYLLLICCNMLFWLKYIKMFYSDINRFSSNSGRSSYTTPKLDKLYFLKCYLQSMNFLYAIILKFIDISFNLIRSIMQGTRQTALNRKTLVIWCQSIVKCREERSVLEGWQSWRTLSNIHVINVGI